MNHFTIAASDSDSTYLVLHIESGQKFEIDRDELKHLYEVCCEWMKKREVS